MPDPIRIRSGSAGRHWPETGRMIPAHWLEGFRETGCSAVLIYVLFRSHTQ